MGSGGWLAAISSLKFNSTLSNGERRGLVACLLMTVVVVTPIGEKMLFRSAAG
jgi:hypothetical protein